MLLHCCDHDGFFITSVEVDPMGPLPLNSVPVAPPATTGAEVAQWTSAAWIVLPARPAPPGPTVEQIIAAITDATQARLDAFAQTRYYDGILSACTYAASTVQKFAAEGQYCVNARDATWAALYAIMAEVEAGTRPMPTGFADVEPDLPVLAWPA